MKTQKAFLALFSLALFFLAFTSCEDEESGKPTAQLEFETVTSSTNLKSTAANTIEFTDGNIILGNVEFQTETESDSLEVDFEIESYITLDFATSVTEPDLSAVEIVPGTYSEIEIEIELWDETDEPSIDLEGTWTDANGTSHPIKLEMPVGQTFSVEIEGEYIVKENTGIIARVTINPNSWFAGDAGELLQDASPNEDGVIVISPNQNSNIYDIVKDEIDSTSEIEIEM
ncbi:MAG: hypothetical protein ACOC1X_03375 [Promethearchaeota archaeon]